MSELLPSLLPFLMAAILVPATAVVAEDWWDGVTAFVPRVPAMVLVDVLAVCLVVGGWWPLWLLLGALAFVAAVLTVAWLGRELRDLIEREGGAW